MRGRSALLISPSRASRRFLLADFFSRMWFLPCFRRTSFPDPLVLNLFLAPLCVFILGITFPYRRIRRDFLNSETCLVSTRLGFPQRFYAVVWRPCQGSKPWSYFGHLAWGTGQLFLLFQHFLRLVPEFLALTRGGRPLGLGT